MRNRERMEKSGQEPIPLGNVDQDAMTDYHNGEPEHILELDGSEDHQHNEEVRTEIREAKYRNVQELKNLLADLTVLDAKTVQYLKNVWHTGMETLELPAVGRISEQAARELETFPGDVSLTGLEQMSDPVAKSLSKHPGKLILTGLESDGLSVKAKRALADHKDLIIPRDLKLEFEDILDKEKNQLDFFEEK